MHVLDPDSAMGRQAENLRMGYGQQADEIVGYVLGEMSRVGYEVVPPCGEPVRDGNNNRFTLLCKAAKHVQHSNQ